jgi:hypothetical protein
VVFPFCSDGLLFLGELLAHGIANAIGEEGEEVT